MSEIEVKWQASDGYIGGQRPQSTTIDPSEFLGLERKEAEKLLHEIIDEDFSQKVCVEYSDFNRTINEIMEAAKKLQEELEAEAND